MAQPYVGEIRMFGGNFAPAGWAFCNGAVLPISENETLFQLIGTTYGGDGQSTFAMPDLRGRLPVHQGNGFVLAEQGGAEEITLTQGQMATHNHPFVGAAVPGDQTSAQGALPANTVTITPYRNNPPDTPFNPGAISPTGGSQPHTNFEPYLCIDFIISLFGIFPSQT
jgi:microcystin-dependent protein